MSKKGIHIIAFDVPFPPDYGGAIDVYFRIKALYSLGYKITLHCFEYGRGMPEELKSITDRIHYYKRRKTILSWFNKLPFIVTTRSTKHLITNLLVDEDPILMEGLHSTFYLKDERLQKRLKLVRTHNIEHEYYSQLADKSTGYKRTFFKSESKKLEKYESVLKFADAVLAIKPSDVEYFKKYCLNTYLLPASMENSEIEENGKTKPYFLYHGNLSVPENEEGILWLINEVFAPLEWTHKLLVAGKNPTEKLKTTCLENGVMLTSDPDDLEMKTVIRLARVHVFFSNQNTGVKLKIINALYSNGHVICNSKMIAGTDLNKLCSIADSPLEYQNIIQEKIKEELSPSELILREQYLVHKYDTKENCRNVIIPILDQFSA